MKYCTECGSELDENVKFCSQCGLEQSIRSNTVSNVEERNKIVFPMAIHVNAWMVFIGSFLMIVSIVLISIYSSDIDMTVKELWFPEGENILLSIFSILNITLSFIAVWITYIKRQYLQYIDKVFYIPFGITVLEMIVSIDYSDSESILIGYGVLALMSLPIIWLYLSKDVKKFMSTVKH